MHPIAESRATFQDCRAIDAASAVLEQCAQFVRDRSAREYGRPCPLLGDSTMGQHVRHSLDHFSAILMPREPGVIDYDHRERDTPVENDPRAAEALIGTLLNSLARVEAQGEPVRVRVMLAADGRESLLVSSIGRELAFAAHHAVHHHAMIAAIARSMGLEVPAEFGVAPSTAHHRMQPR